MTELPHQHAPEIPVTCRDKNVEQSTPGSGWKVLRRIAIAACLLLVVALGMLGVLPPADSPRSANPEYWYGRIGDTSTFLALVIAASAAATWLWNSTRAQADAEPQPIRARLWAVLRRAWVVVFGIYAVYCLYIGVIATTTIGSDVQSRVVWLALCLSATVGFTTSALWIHWRGTPKARPWSEGLRNALSWVLTWLLAYFAFGFLMLVLLPRRTVLDQAWYQRLASSAIDVGLALLCTAAAMWVWRKTRAPTTNENRSPAATVGDHTEVR